MVTVFAFIWNIAIMGKVARAVDFTDRIRLNRSLVHFLVYAVEPTILRRSGQI